MKRLEITTLKPGWAEWDELMLHASFQCLVNFMEKENPKQIDWHSDPESEEIWKEINDLYKWWTKKRPKRKITTNLLKNGLYEEEDEDQRYFKRLVDIRFYLWV